MSNKISLESKQRLPGKMQSIICDSALIMQHATCAAGCSELLNASAKQLCAMEQFFSATNTSLNKLGSVLNSMQQQCGEVKDKISVVSDVLETLQNIERYKYFTEDGLRPACDSDLDSTS